MQRLSGSKVVGSILHTTVGRTSVGYRLPVVDGFANGNKTRTRRRMKARTRAENKATNKKTISTAPTISVAYGKWKGRE